jgi:hypothetical protein
LFVANKYEKRDGVAGDFGGCRSEKRKHDIKATNLDAPMLTA